MREVTIKLAGKELTLLANFKASLELAEKVCDPMQMAREASVTDAMHSRGINYTPKWQFDIDNVPQVIYIGLKAAGSTMKLEEVQELVFEEGFFSAMSEATRYVTHIVGPQTEEEMEPSDDKGEPGKS